ncbi:hypothetical protein [Nostoc sp. UHCC 0251]|nr:hypothetical protein [Nostoc sp. UHCC 0251]MEA5625956.1 hypothetical protein [Nostoc sp. UHCC 0251]
MDVKATHQPDFTDWYFIGKGRGQEAQLAEGNSDLCQEARDNHGTRV